MTLLIPLIKRGVSLDLRVIAERWVVSFGDFRLLRVRSFPCHTVDTVVSALRKFWMVEGV